MDLPAANRPLGQEKSVVLPGPSSTDCCQKFKVYKLMIEEPLNFVCFERNGDKYTQIFTLGSFEKRPILLEIPLERNTTNFFSGRIDTNHEYSAWFVMQVNHS